MNLSSRVSSDCKDLLIRLFRDHFNMIIKWIQKFVLNWNYLFTYHIPYFMHTVLVYSYTLHVLVLSVQQLSWFMCIALQCIAVYAIHCILHTTYPKGGNTGIFFACIVCAILCIQWDYRAHSYAYVHVCVHIRTVPVHRHVRTVQYKNWIYSPPVF